MPAGPKTILVQYDQPSVVLTHTHTHTDARTHAHTHAHTHTQTQTHTHTHTHTDTHAHTHTHTHNASLVLVHISLNTQGYCAVHQQFWRLFEIVWKIDKDEAVQCPFILSGLDMIIVIVWFLYTIVMVIPWYNYSKYVNHTVPWYYAITI